MKHLFIINPAAGRRGSTAALECNIHDTFANRDVEYQVLLTSQQGDAEQMTRAACAEGKDLRVYACGGDGTLNEVANGAAGCPYAAVTNVPTGTGNDFLKIFGVDNRHRFTDLPALLEGPQAPMDLMDCNGKLGIGIVCAGLDARVAADVDRYKRAPLVTGGGAYILSLAVNVLFKGIARPMAVTMGTRRLNEDIALICICNGRYYGGGFMPVGEAEPDDGILDMLVVPKISLGVFLRMVGEYAKGRYQAHPEYILAHHGKTITFSSQRTLVAVVDGEMMEGNAFTVCLSDKTLNFFYPGDLSYRAKVGTPSSGL